MPTYASATLDFTRKKVIPFVLGAWVATSGGPAVFQYVTTGTTASSANKVLKVKDGSGHTVFDVAENGSTSQSGAIVTESTMSGSQVTANATSGSGKIKVHGPDGGKICFRDTDGAGWTAFDCLNGTCTARSVANSECTF